MPDPPTPRHGRDHDRDPHGTGPEAPPGRHLPSTGSEAALRPFARGEIVERLHHGPSLFSLVITGGGFQAVTDLLNRPGASRTVHHVEIPYHQTALERLLPHLDGPAVSEDVAVGLALGARRRLGEDRGTGAVPATDLHGVGVTAALATDRNRRGDSHAWVALAGGGGVCRLHLELPRSAGVDARLSQDRLVSDMILWVMAGSGPAPTWAAPETGPGAVLTVYPPASGARG